MADGKNTTIYFKDSATLDRLQRAADKSGVSASKIIDAVITGLLSEIEEQLPNQRTLRIAHLTVKV